VISVSKSEPTIEGAGVKLKRAFGFPGVPNLDPFLLLDDFHSKNPQDYIAGFPWHPHRGIETVTYMISGAVMHGDSIGNKGVIESGDVQWMTAGSGIIHQEMPEAWEGMMQGFQLWVNLPKSHKMMDPRYRGIRSDEIPELDSGEGVKTRIIAGTLGDKVGPVKDLVVDCAYFDIDMEPNSAFEYEAKDGYKVFVYVFKGSGHFNTQMEKGIHAENLLVFDDKGAISTTSGEKGLRFLLVSGKPLNEPVAWRGPIVMNTDEELAIAFKEYREGTFIKHRRTKPVTTYEGCEYYHR